MSKPKPDPRPLGAAHSWARTPATYLAGQAHIDGADHVAHEMELKWGAGRLRRLVSLDLCEKFDRQRYLFNQAIWHGDLEAVRREASRMTSAWQALDKAATGMAPRAPPDVWEVVLENGTVAAILRDDDARIRRGMVNGRKVVVYTLAEIGRLLSAYPAIAEAKLTFPGATVEAVRHPSDPLDAIVDTAGDLDDPLNDPIPHFGN